MLLLVLFVGLVKRCLVNNMIYLSIPAEYIPNSEKHEIETPIYVKGQFTKFENICFVSLTSELTLDNAYDPNNFFIALSGNEFGKLIERDILPNWVSPQDLIDWSTASCTVDSNRKITWVRVKSNTQLHALH